MCCTFRLDVGNHIKSSQLFFILRALGPCRSARAFSVAASRGHASHLVAFLVAEQALKHRLSACGTRA